jgi:hypothetical protein
MSFNLVRRVWALQLKIFDKLLYVWVINIILAGVVALYITMPQRGFEQHRLVDVGGSLSVTEFRSRLHWPSYREALEKLKPSRGLFRNFQLCPHCEKNGRNPIVERINDCAPIISRSDGETFHLVLGDRPIS